MDKYLTRAKNYIDELKCEEAITACISGIERGSAKCAYTLAYMVFMIGTDNIMTEDEAQEIFAGFYEKLKALACNGDPEAMYMVAESIRLNLVEDEDESFGEWLERSASLGYEAAISLLNELYESEEPIEPEMRYDKHGIEIKECHAATMTLDLTSDASIRAFSESLSRDDAESVIRAEPDYQTLLDLGIDEVLEAEEKQREIDNTEGNREDKWGGV